MGFGDVLQDGNAFCDRFLQVSQPSRRRPQLIHIATDGETYGHHKKFGERALAYAVHQGFASRGMEITNYGAFLDRFPPVHEVEIDEGPKGEGTSWSCCHGVGRWKEDCGCSTGGMPGWNQKWREPLREALDFLRDELGCIFEGEGAKVFKDVWEARNGYIDVILDRSPEERERFFEKYATGGLDEKGALKALKLLEMERHALQMYTSCGWFFADLAGHETVIVLQHAARAIQLAEELTGQAIETGFLQRLSEGRSNLPEMGEGIQVYRRLVKPKCVTLEKVVNDYAVSSLLSGKERKKKIHCYRVERVDEEKRAEGKGALVLGQVRVSSEIIPEAKEFVFALISSPRDIFRTWVAEYKDELQFGILKKSGVELAGKNEKERTDILTSFLGNRIFTIRDILKDEKEAVFQRLLQEEVDQYHRDCSELFGRSRQVMDLLTGEGLEIPSEIHIAAEIALSDRLLKEVERLREDFRGTLDRGEIDRILEDAQGHGIKLRGNPFDSVLNEILDDQIKRLQQTMEADQPGQSERIDGIVLFLNFAGRGGFELREEEVQDRVHEMLGSCAETVEKSWWGGGVARSFPASLISLAERLGFNVDRFRKLIVPSPLHP